MNKTSEYQVVIVGGGIVGAALALALSRAGLNVAMLEHKPANAYKPGQEYGLRVSAVSIASQYMLQRLGCWENIQTTRVSPYTEMHVWDALGGASVHFDSVELQLDQLGHIIENDLLQTVLWEELHHSANFKLGCPAEIQDISAAARLASIRLKTGERIHAQLVVGADGAESLVRKFCGIDVESWSYKQRGVVAVVRPEAPHRATAWQRFLPTGPLALLPLQSDLCSIVWSSSEQESQRLLALEEVAFCEALGIASEYRLGKIIDCGPRAAFPLRYQHAKAYISQRMALIGDAAHVVHPLAGQGVNLGLQDVAFLAQQLIQAHRQGIDCGSPKLLRRYQRNRQAENKLMALAFDAINRLFGQEFEPIVQLRNAGMSMVDQSNALKQFFMLRASGLNTVLRESAEYKKSGNSDSLLIAPEFIENERLLN
jgi:2-octaprenylphenol hydroxylase